MTNEPYDKPSENPDKDDAAPAVEVNADEANVTVEGDGHDDDRDDRQARAEAREESADDDDATD